MLFPPNTRPLRVKAAFSFPPSSIPFSLSSICYRTTNLETVQMWNLFSSQWERILGLKTLRYTGWLSIVQILPDPLFPFLSAGACGSWGQPPCLLGIDLTSTSRTRLSFTLRSLGLQGDGVFFCLGPASWVLTQNSLYSH